jgi:hypothetical protein
MVKREAGNFLALALVHPFSLFGNLNVIIIFGSCIRKNRDGVMLN